MQIIASILCFFTVLFGVQHAEQDAVRWSWRNRHPRSRKRLREFHAYWQDYFLPNDWRA